MSRVLIDTSVLIRAYESAAGDPRVDQAKQALETLARAGSGVLCVRSLDEFTAVALDRAVPRVPVPLVRETLARLSGVFGILHPSSHTLDRALDAVDRHRLRFRDSFLWAIAREYGVGEVLTERLPETPVIDGVAYRSP